MIIVVMQSTEKTPSSFTKLQQNVDYKTIFLGKWREMAQEKRVYKTVQAQVHYTL